MFRSRLRQCLIALALGAALLAAPSATYAQAGACNPRSYTVPGAATFPESVAYEPATNMIYVGSADGTVYRGALGSDALQPFLPGGVDGRTALFGVKVDDHGRLFLAGANTGLIFVYSTADGRLLAKFDTGTAPNAFVNDIAITPSGDAYVTDSLNPTIYRVYTDGQGQLQFERWLDLSGTPIVYGVRDGVAGFVNLNGIAATADGASLIVSQTNTATLFRITIASRSIVPIDLGGEPMPGDGLLLDGQMLYAVRFGSQVALIKLAPDLASGQLVAAYTDPTLKLPTAVAKAGDCILITNAQLDKQIAQQPPELPFTLASLPASTLAQATLPAQLPRTGAGTEPPLTLLALGLLLFVAGAWCVIRLRRRLA